MLMDYNNAPATTHPDIMHVLELAMTRIEQEISERKEGRDSPSRPAAWWC